MIPSAYAGFCPFRRHHRVVHWLGYGTAVGVYLLGYGLVAAALASAVPVGGVVPIAAAATIAALPTGLYLGWLYGRAVGSPYGNLLLALVTPALVPWAVYTSPFPETTVLWGTLNHPEVVAPAGLAGLAAMLWRVDRTYARMDDPAAWEREVMPSWFRVADGEYLGEQHPQETDGGDGDGERGDDDTPGLNPRMAGGSELPREAHGRLGRLAELDRETSLGLSVRGWLASLVFVPPVVALALYGQATYGEDGAFGGVVLLAMLVMIHWSLRVDERDEADR